MGNINKKQFAFVHKIASWIHIVYEKGYTLTFGDAWSEVKQLECPHCKKEFTYRGGHSKKSWHPKRLAVDFNLFRNGLYLQETEDHAIIGADWKALGGTWGGDFPDPDGNHYSLGEKNANALYTYSR